LIADNEPQPTVTAAKHVEQTVASNSDNMDRVAVMQTANVGRRVYDKKQFCLFCGLGFAELPRHWTSQHSNEREVRDSQYIRCGGEEETDN